MKAHRTAHSIATLGWVLEVSASGSSAWLARARSARAEGGAPRIHAELVAPGDITSIRTWSGFFSVAWCPMRGAG